VPNNCFWTAAVLPLLQFDPNWCARMSYGLSAAPLCRVRSKTAVHLACSDLLDDRGVCAAAPVYPAHHPYGGLAEPEGRAYRTQSGNQ
jgi:hypothetical protein